MNTPNANIPTTTHHAPQLRAPELPVDLAPVEWLKETRALLASMNAGKDRGIDSRNLRLAITALEDVESRIERHIKGG